jgi:hypothetical protein
MVGVPPTWRMNTSSGARRSYRLTWLALVRGDFGGPTESRHTPLGEARLQGDHVIWSSTSEFPEETNSYPAQ